jgi:Zn-dependent protease
LVAVILGIILRFTDVGATTAGPGLSFLLVLQISAVLFNLIPLPPFDGYNALEPFLNDIIRMQMDRVRRFTMWIVFLAFWYIPFISSIFWTAVFIISSILGVDWDLAVTGLERFRFWEL